MSPIWRRHPFTKEVRFAGVVAEVTVCYWCEQTWEGDNSCCEMRELATLLDGLAPEECPSHDSVNDPEAGCDHCTWAGMRRGYEEDQ